MSDWLTSNPPGITDTLMIIKNRMMKNLLIILLGTMISCNLTEQNNTSTIKSFEFAVYNNEPIFEDEHLYNKKIKNSINKLVKGVSIYLIDWNNNDKYFEKGIDYIGIKSSLDNIPTIERIEESNSLNINGKSYSTKIIDDNIQLVEKANLERVNLNLVTKYFPIELMGNKRLDIEFTSDSTVIYFWATWCAPCIETLKQIGPKNKKLKEIGINIIPVAYNCSDSKEFLERNNLPYENFQITEKSAQEYNIQSLSKQYTFLKDGSIADSNVKLRKYYH